MVVDGVIAVGIEIDRALASHFVFDGATNQLFIEWGDDSLNGQAVAWRRFDERHIAQAHERHVQSTRDGRGGKREGVDVFANFFQSLFVGYAEALFFVDNHQPQVLDANIPQEDPLRTDYDVDFACFQSGEDLLLLRGRTATAVHLYTDG